jgi:predicted dehydrogenase
MKKIRWGLLSTANINRRLIPAIRASQRGELIAIASRSESSARAYAKEWEIPLAYASYQAMLDSGEIDAVYIGLPNHLHAEWTIKALQAGVHVLCEKPFALSLEEVDQMIAASQQYNRVLAEAFMYRHHPQTKKVGEWVQSGKLGKITLVQGIFNFKVANQENVRLKKEYGGGSLWDVGVYPLSFAQYVYGGPPEAVLGMQQQGQTGVDLVFAGQMMYPGGGLAQISSSLCTPLHTSIEIIGQNGRLSLNKPFVGLDEGRSIIFFPTEGEALEIDVEEKDLYLGEVEDMHAAILDGAKPYLDLLETRNHVHTILALYESASQNKIVTL